MHPAQELVMDHSVDALASAFTALRRLGIKQRGAYSDVLRHALDAQPQLFGVWSVWEPDCFDGRDHAFRFAPGHDCTGRFVPYWHRAHGSPKLEPVTGYERQGPGDWYWIPLKHGERCEIDPYSYVVAGRLRYIRSEVMPLFDDGRCVGVVGVDEPVSPPHSTRLSVVEPVIHFSGLHESAERIRRLTAREREVHHWLTEGKTNDEIAGILGISPHTVKHHVDHIFKKLGVENRYAAALAGRP
jgi:DNA-binding CsgD family transcriptional regulator